MFIVFEKAQTILFDKTNIISYNYIQISIRRFFKCRVWDLRQIQS